MRTIENHELLESVKGIDEEGKSKAQVTVGIMDVVNNEMIDSVTSLYGVLEAAIVPELNSAFQIVFSDPVDYEYLQLSSLLESYTKLVSGANDEGKVPPLLTLTIMPVGDLEKYITVVGAMYSYMATKPNEIPHGIHFIAPTENIEFFELEEDTVNELLDEIDEEAFLEEMR